LEADRLFDFQHQRAAARRRGVAGRRACGVETAGIDRRDGGLGMACREYSHRQEKAAIAYAKREAEKQ